MADFGSLAPNLVFNPMQFQAPQMKNTGIGGQGMNILKAALAQQKPGMVNPNAPVNPGLPPPAGDPAYFPGGEGPMAGGSAQPMGMLQMLLSKLGGGGGLGGSPGAW